MILDSDPKLDKLADTTDVPVVCPLLGIDSDETTSFGFLTEDNRCWRLKRAAEVSPNHQAKYCFTGDHVNCPVYKTGRLAPGVKFVRGGSASFGFLGGFGWRSLIVTLEAGLVLGVLVMGAYLWLSVPAAPEATAVSIPTNTPLPTAILIVEVPTALPTLAVTVPPLYASPFPSATSTLSNTPLPSATAAFTAAPGLDQPIGPFNLVAHQVAADENLIGIAARFATNTDVLQKVNGLTAGENPAVGRVLVVPQGMTDPNQFSKLVAFQTVQDTQLSAIVSQLSVDINQARSINALGESDLVPAGRWLFIPQP